MALDDDIAKTTLTEVAKKAVAEAWEKKGRIREIVSRISRWLGFVKASEASEGTKPPSGILILGPGGTGKTTLARLLSGDVDTVLDPPGPYEASTGIEHYQLNDSPAVGIVVPPGQHHRRDATWNGLLADVAAGVYRGVILVTAYGHQSIARDSCKQHPLFETRKDEFVPALLEQQRVDELSIVERLVPILRVTPGKLWMLSVIAKQDLWWPERDEVERYYREGPYHTTLSEIAERQSFRHELCTVALVIQNWKTRANESLKQNARGYDQVLQRESVQHLFELIDALRCWEAGQ